MPNDAKLGLIAGVAVVLLIAAMFFRKEPAQGQAAAEPPSVPTSVVPEAKLPTSVPAAPPRTTPQSDYEFPPLPPPPALSESVP